MRANAARQRKTEGGSLHHADVSRSAPCFGACRVEGFVECQRHAHAPLAHNLRLAEQAQLGAGQLAQLLGYEDASFTLAVEQLMQRYYRTAKLIIQLNTILLQNIEERLFPQEELAVPINERFNEVNGFIDIAADDVFEKTPSAMLEIFVLMTGKRLA